jgi:murein DD-endopeptidase MepM/ murein hydrolase activator NlpD
VGRLVDPDVREDGGLEPVLEAGAPLPAVISETSPTQAQPAAQAGASAAAGALAVAEAPAGATSTGFQVNPVERTMTAPVVVPEATPLPPGVKPLPTLELPEPEIPAPQTGVAPSEAASLERTEPIRRGPAPLDFEGLTEGEDGARYSRDLALESISSGLLGTRRGGAGEPPRSALSPNLVAFFAAVTGVLTVATIIAISMRLDQGHLLPKRATSTTPSVAPQSSTIPPAASPPVVRKRNRIPGPYRVKDSAADPALRIGEGQIGFDPFLKAVEKAGLPLKEAYRVLKAFEKVRPLNNCSKSDRFAFALDRASRRVKTFEYIAGPEEIFQAREGADGLLNVEKLDLKIQREQVQGAFVVADAGLERAVTAGGFEPALIRALREAMTGHSSLDEFAPGTRVRVIAQEVTALGDFARYAGIEALEIVFPAERKPLRIYFFNGPKSRGYFDESARSPYEGGWRTPIPNAPITSRFNMKRMHPVLHKIMPHTGMDFGAPMGTPVGACSFGTVSFLGWGGPSGNLVKVQHSDDIETGYAHLSRFAEGLKVGDKVTRLQTVGYVGSTGRSTGPHLHFTAKRKGEFIDPESLKLDALRVLPSDERAVFMEHKAQYDAKLDAIALPEVPRVATPSPAASAPGEGMEDELGEGEEGAHAPSAASAPTPPPPAPPGAPRAAGPALYLTDEELRQQKSTDGEVEE